MSISPRVASIEGSTSLKVLQHTLSTHKIEKLDLSSIPPARIAAEDEVVLTSTVPNTWPSPACVANHGAGEEPKPAPPSGANDVATARPSHRKLAGIHAKSFDLEKGHRVEVYVRVR